MIDTIDNPRLRRLYEYWLARRGARRLPARADIDALDLSFLMGNLILIDVIPGTPPRFFLRLHGTNLVHRVGYELSGKMLDEMPDIEFRNLAQQTFAHVARTGEPFRSRRDRVLDDKIQRYETLILPLSNDGSQVDRLLIGLIYDGEREPN